jgi:multiple sugar transport system permease protein
MVIYLAGLQAIPGELYEAAAIDGAGSWTRFWRITLPLLTPTIFFNLVLSIISTFQTFTNAFVATNGGPLDATLFYVLYLYKRAFEFLDMGYASALAWVLFAIVLGLTLLVLRSQRFWVFYAGERSDG